MFVLEMVEMEWLLFVMKNILKKVDLQEEMEVEAEVFILSAVHPLTPY